MHNQLINIAQELGPDLRTRSFFRRDLENLLAPKKHINQVIVLNFIFVNFISRSVADELCNMVEENPYLHIIGMQGEVEAMYRLVKIRRLAPREYPSLKAEVYHLKTIEDMQAFFSVF